MSEVLDQISDEIRKEMEEWSQLRREAKELDIKSDNVLMPGGKLVNVGSAEWNTGMDLFDQADAKWRRAAAIFEQCKGKYKIAMIVYNAETGRD